MEAYPFDKLCELTLAEVEEMYRNGRVSQEDYEHYCYLWRNSAFRYTDLCIAYQYQEDNNGKRI